MPSAPAADRALAFSTSWNTRRSSAVGPVLDAIRGLGFRRIELGYLTPPMVEGIADELADRGMLVQSLHNPSPWPVDGSGTRVSGVAVDALASPDPAQRADAVARCKATIDLARRLGAGAVVVHLGHLEPPVPQSQLFALLRDGRADEFAPLRDRAVSEREARKAPCLRAALASLRELGERASEAGVELGIETRDAYNEIPSLAEFDEVFAAADGLPVGYWHDVGHAEKQARLGLATQGDYLRRLGQRLVGVHLHDTILDRDHKAPGRGDTDWPALAALLPARGLRTLELNDAPTAEEALEGIGLLRRLGLA